MNTNRIIWGLIFLFVGSILLLDNLNVITFYWRNVWMFWPILLLIFGVKLLLNRNEKKLGTNIALAILSVSLIFIFYFGQQKPKHHNWYDNDSTIIIDDSEWEYNSKNSQSYYAVPFLNSDSTKKTNLKISGGAVSLKLDDIITDSLVEAKIDNNNGYFSLQSQRSDSVNTVIFSMNKNKKIHKKNWNFNYESPDVKLKLNPIPIYDIDLETGASEIDLDLAAFKINQFNFNGGASDVELKIGDKLLNTEINIETGAANVEINYPINSGGRIVSKGGLYSSDFDGFVKKGSGVYETPNFNQAKNKIFINIKGGLSNFEVKPY